MTVPREARIPATAERKVGIMANGKRIGDARQFPHFNDGETHHFSLPGAAPRPPVTRDVDSGVTLLEENDGSAPGEISMNGRVKSGDSTGTRRAGSQAESRQGGDPRDKPHLDDDLQALGTAIGPAGRPMTEDDLPPTDTKRWVMRRKAEVVAGVRAGIITLEEACRRYRLTVEEFVSWQRLIDKHGVRGLRATRLQQYRDRSQESSESGGE